MRYDDQSPVLFHLHSQSLATTVNKILYHNFAGKSDSSQKNILTKAIQNRSQETLYTLGKFQLIKKLTEGPPMQKFEMNARFLSLMHSQLRLSFPIPIREKEKEMLYRHIDPAAAAWVLASTF
jgi:hypothetical protein